MNLRSSSVGSDQTNEAIDTTERNEFVGQDGQDQSRVGAQSTAAAPPHQQEPAEVGQVSNSVTSWTSLISGVPGVFGWREVQ